MIKNDLYIYEMSDNEWRNIGYVNPQITEQCKKDGVYDTEGNLIIEAVPFKIRDELIAPRLDSEIRRYYCKKSLRCSRYHDEIFSIIFKSPLSDYYIQVTGDCTVTLAYRLSDLELSPEHKTPSVVKYLKTLIKLTRLANKEVE